MYYFIWRFLESTKAIDMKLNFQSLPIIHFNDLSTDRSQPKGRFSACFFATVEVTALTE